MSKEKEAVIGATGLPENIVFYCKDCHEIKNVQRLGRRYVYTCADCGTKNVAFGTLRSITSFFHLDKKRPEKKEEVKDEATE